MAVALQCNRLPLSHNASSSSLSWEQLRTSKPVNYKACCNLSQFKSPRGRKGGRCTCAEVDNLALQTSVETPRDDVVWQDTGSKSCCYSCLCCICSCLLHCCVSLLEILDISLRKATYAGIFNFTVLWRLASLYNVNNVPKTLKS